MALFAITGGATGIGAALRKLLEDQGDQVLTVDIKDGDIIADLSTPGGRQAAVEAIRRQAPGGLDGYIPCAGVPPVAKPLSLVPAVNYFGVVETVAAIRDLVARRRGTVLLVASNSAPMIGIDDPYVSACLDGDEAAATAALAGRDGQTAYAGSKRALCAWMRRHVVAYAREGVRMNAVAPGITMTPLSEQVMSDAALGPAIRQFGDMVPWGGTARPEQIAAVMRFLLGPEADYVCGSVLFVDGGSDAMLRPDAL